MDEGTPQIEHTHEPFAAVSLGQHAAGHVAERVPIEEGAEDETLRLGIPVELAAAAVALFREGK